jgi:hypothetical protein
MPFVLTGFVGVAATRDLAGDVFMVGRDVFMVGRDVFMVGRDNGVSCGLGRMTCFG